jgi:hypothetical protein
MLPARALASAAIDYVRKNPDEIVHAAVNAAGLRFAVPLAALRWLSARANLPERAPQDIDIGSAPPALRVTLSLETMGTPVRASVALRVESIDLSPDSIRVGFRLREVKLALRGESRTPVATLIKSGALDLSKPGSFVKALPEMPPAVVEAEDDRIVIDLMKLPFIANNILLRKALAVVTPVVSVRAIETDRDHLYVAFRATPRGLPQSFAALRESFG